MFLMKKYYQPRLQNVTLKFNSIQSDSQRSNSDISSFIVKEIEVSENFFKPLQQQNYYYKNQEEIFLALFFLHYSNICVSILLNIIGQFILIFFFRAIRLFAFYFKV